MLYQNTDFEGTFIIAIVAARDDITISAGGEVAAICAATARSLRRAA